jgi:S-formylglutathione hydrolase FrmB
MFWRRRSMIVVPAFVGLAVVAYAVFPRVDTRGATLSHTTLHSRYVHRAERITLIAPAGGGSGRPLLVFLHGRQENGRGEDSNINDAFFSALHALGSRAPDVVMPNGAIASYWHNRSSGDWDNYVVDEVIPLAVARLHADPRKVAIGGISMGGFGAFDIARHHPGRFCAVGGHSPALWQTGGETAAGAFDDAQDFARNDLIALAARHPSPWGHTRMWIDAGLADPFGPGDEAFVAALRQAGTEITVHRWPGAHTDSYWHAHYAAYLRFYADAFAACHG